MPVKRRPGVAASYRYLVMQRGPRASWVGMWTSVAGRAPSLRKALALAATIRRRSPQVWIVEKGKPATKRA